jgi:hypothetical protein
MTFHFFRNRWAMLVAVLFRIYIPLTAFLRFIKVRSRGLSHDCAHKPGGTGALMFLSAATVPASVAYSLGHPYRNDPERRLDRNFRPPSLSVVCLDDE